MTPTVAATKRRELINAMDYAGEQWAQACKPHKIEMGLVSEEFRKSPEYKRLSEEFYTAKDKLAVFMKNHQGKEYAEAFKSETIEHFKQKRQ